MNFYLVKCGFIPAMIFHFPWFSYTIRFIEKKYRGNSNGNGISTSLSVKIWYFQSWGEKWLTEVQCHHFHDSLYLKTRTKTSIRYAKENDRKKREKERERKKGTRRDIEREGEKEWERERWKARRVNPSLRLMLSPNYGTRACKKGRGTRTVFSLRGKSSGIMSGNYPWIIRGNYHWELSEGITTMILSISMTQNFLDL